jgi:hypothetical protein
MVRARTPIVQKYGEQGFGAECEFEKKRGTMKWEFLIHQQLKRLGVGPSCRIALTARASISDPTLSLGKCQASHNREEKASWEL